MFKFILFHECLLKETVWRDVYDIFVSLWCHLRRNGVSILSMQVLSQLSPRTIYNPLLSVSHSMKSWEGKAGP